MIYRQVHELAADGFPVAVICRCLGVSRSGYYGWRNRRPSARRVADLELMTTISEIHTMSRYSYGAPRCMPSFGSAWACGVVANASHG
jgi:putative transposase